MITKSIDDEFFTNFNVSASLKTQGRGNKRALIKTPHTLYNQNNYDARNLLLNMKYNYP